MPLPRHIKRAAVGLAAGCKAMELSVGSFIRVRNAELKTGAVKTSTHAAGTKRSYVAEAARSLGAGHQDRRRELGKSAQVLLRREHRDDVARVVIVGRRPG